MSGERIDPELLAAFLDGTALSEEREAVMRTLAKSNDAYREFIEAAAVKRDLDTADASEPTADATAPVPIARTRRAYRWYTGPVLLAAGVAGVIILGQLRRGTSEGPVQLAQATRLTQASGSGSLARALGPSWDQPVWSMARGAGASLAVHPRAFRAGALYANLEAAAIASDSAAVLRASESLTTLLASVEAGAPFATRVRNVVGAPDFGGQPERAATARQLRALLGADAWFDLGVWTETARLAIAARSMAFFEPGSAGLAEGRRIFRVEVSPADSVEWAAAVDPLRPFLTDASRSSIDLDSLGRAVRDAMVIAGH